MNCLQRIQFLNQQGIQAIKDGKYLESMGLLSKCLSIMKTEVQKKKQKEQQSFSDPPHNIVLSYKCIARRRTDITLHATSASSSEQLMSPFEIILIPLKPRKIPYVHCGGTAHYTSSSTPCDPCNEDGDMDDEEEDEGEIERYEPILIFALLFNLALAHQVFASWLSFTRTAFEGSIGAPVATFVTNSCIKNFHERGPAQGRHPQIKANDDYVNSALRLYELSYRSLQESSPYMTVPQYCYYIVMIMTNVASVHKEIGNVDVAKQYHDHILSVVMVHVANHQTQYPTHPTSSHHSQDQDNHDSTSLNNGPDETLEQQELSIRCLIGEIMPILFQTSSSPAPAA